MPDVIMVDDIDDAADTPPSAVGPAAYMPFRLDVDVSVSTFPCAGHGGYTCGVIITPGDVCYGRRSPGTNLSMMLCSSCGHTATSELQQAARRYLLDRSNGVPQVAE